MGQTFSKLDPTHIVNDPSSDPTRQLFVWGKKSWVGYVQPSLRRDQVAQLNSNGNCFTQIFSLLRSAANRPKKKLGVRPKHTVKFYRQNKN